MASITSLVNSFDVNSKEFESLVHDLMISNSDVLFDSHEVRSKYFFKFLLSFSYACNIVLHNALFMFTFQVDTVQNAFVKSVNCHTNQSDCDFLPILDNILPTCSKDTFSKYGLSWIIHTTKILENVHIHAQDLILACKVLGILVERCKEIPELHKQISMQHVKQLINILSSL